MTSIFTELVHIFAKWPAEVCLQVQDFLLCCCVKDPLVALHLFQVIVPFDTFPFSIINFIFT